MSPGCRALKAQASLVGGLVASPPHLLGAGVVAQSHSGRRWQSHGVTACREAETISFFKKNKT